eukprot:15451698-Alexandrium_andersonii.AAC.2
MWCASAPGAAACCAARGSNKRDTAPVGHRSLAKRCAATATALAIVIRAGLAASRSDDAR